MLCGISTRFRVLSPSYGQVTHALLTRPPLSTPNFNRSLHPKLPARLACVRHAASVRPEPGSNSLVNSLYQMYPIYSNTPNILTRSLQLIFRQTYFRLVLLSPLTARELLFLLYKVYYLKCILTGIHPRPKLFKSLHCLILKVLFPAASKRGQRIFIIPPSLVFVKYFFKLFFIFSLMLLTKNSSKRLLIYINTSTLACQVLLLKYFKKSYK